MKIKLLAAIAGLVIFTSASAFAGWSFELHTGSAYSFPMWMKIQQYGEEDIELTGEYETRPWNHLAPYYDLRVGKWDGDSAWEFESLHHKVFLKNKPEEVEAFNISHGYNMNMVNRAYKVDGFIYRYGGGIVMTHPETTIRGREWEDEGGVNGFYISGICGQGAVQKRFAIGSNWFFSLEAKLTVADAIIPVAGGEAHVPNVALHGLFGVGYDL
ncbi:MAG: hypothetical protein C0609_01020 [Deltaproteobacteria bacterium]|nr:MAG: hypothetical protein C0609_01020 [Deltaproteobacteria bacterium]